MHEIIQVGDLTVTLLKSGAETQGRFSLCEFIFPAKQRGFPLHLHRDCDQMLVGVSGHSIWTIGAKQIRLRPGERLFIPRGTVHDCFNQGTEVARVACMYSPACVGPEFFRDLSLATVSDEQSRIAHITEVLARANMIPPPASPSA